MVRGFLILIVLLILLITGAPAVAQKPMFEISVDRTIIQVDETFHLNITLTGSHSGIALDLSPFTTDVDILSTSQPTHSANIDGQTEISMEWIITLAPKRLGELVIPSMGLLKKAASGVLAILPCSRITHTLRASKWLRPCWPDFFEPTRSL
jgi:hypothetical protein